MPKRTDIKRIPLIGSGPIVIGQACELDDSRTQACRALLEADYRATLINGTPAATPRYQLSIGLPRPG